MDDCAAAVATADCTHQLESTNRFVNVDTTDDEILYAEARQLDSVEYRRRASETFITVVDTEEKYGPVWPLVTAEYSH